MFGTIAQPDDPIAYFLARRRGSGIAGMGMRDSGVCGITILCALNPATLRRAAAARPRGAIADCADDCAAALRLRIVHCPARGQTGSGKGSVAPAGEFFESAASASRHRLDTSGSDSSAASIGSAISSGSENLAAC